MNLVHNVCVNNLQLREGWEIKGRSWERGARGKERRTEKKRRKSLYKFSWINTTLISMQYCRARKNKKLRQNSHVKMVYKKQVKTHLLYLSKTPSQMNKILSCSSSVWKKISKKLYQQLYKQINKKTIQNITPHVEYFSYIKSLGNNANNHIYKIENKLSI